MLTCFYCLIEFKRLESSTKISNGFNEISSRSRSRLFKFKRFERRCSRSGEQNEKDMIKIMQHELGQQT